MKKLIIAILLICTLKGVDNIGDDILNISCKDKDYQRCYDAIYNYRIDNDSSEINWNLIQKLYINLCNSGFAEACMSLGNLYTVNSISEIKTNLKKSAKYNTRGCELGDMVACNNLGVMYRYGKYYKKDYKKAFELFKKSCKDKGHSATLKACASQEKTRILLQGNLD